MKKILIKSLLLSCILAGAVAVPSCKKNNSEETKLYLNGEVQFSGYPLFVSKKDSITFKASGVTHPEGNALGLVRAALSKTDTLFKAGVDVLPEKAPVGFRFPDSLATFNIVVYIYPLDSDKYYSKSSTLSITTVDEKTSIPQIVFSAEEGEDCTLLDERDNQWYNKILVGNSEWLRSNLYYAGTKSSPCGTPYYHDEAVRRIFGQFYTWEEAQHACPEGWHLPSNQEWMDLANVVNPAGKYSDPFADFNGIGGKLLVDAYFNGDKMWEFWPDVDVPKDMTKSVLKIIPAGYYNAGTSEVFRGMLDYACFWTSETNPEDSSQGLYRYIYKKENAVKIGSADKKSMAMPVRCVRNVK